MDWQSIKDLKKKKCRPIIQVKNLTKQERKKQTGGEGERERGIFIGHLTFNTDFGEKKNFYSIFCVGYLSSLVQNLSIEAHRTTDWHCKINLI